MTTLERANSSANKPVKIYDVEHPHYPKLFWSVLGVVSLTLTGVVVAGLDAQEKRITTGTLSEEMLQDQPVDRILDLGPNPTELAANSDNFVITIEK
jgi:hypothetical protein